MKKVTTTEASDTTTIESSDEDEYTTKNNNGEGVKKKPELNIDSLVETLEHEQIPDILKRPTTVKAISQEFVESTNYFDDIDDFALDNEDKLITTDNGNGAALGNKSEDLIEEVTDLEQSYNFEKVSYTQVVTTTGALYHENNPMNVNVVEEGGASQTNTSEKVAEAPDETLYEFLENDCTATSSTEQLATLIRVMGALVLKHMETNTKLDSILTLLITNRASETETFEKSSNIPVSSEKDLAELNNNLNDDTFRAKMVSF